MEPLAEINIDYEELMTLATALGLLIEQNKTHSGNFKQANLPDLAATQNKTAERILETLKEKKAWLEQAKGGSF